MSECNEGRKKDLALPVLPLTLEAAALDSPGNLAAAGPSQQGTQHGEPATCGGAQTALKSPLKQQENISKCYHAHTKARGA
jgi:hypothetical protein